MNYLFLFTVSPVQSFIAEARKTRDLFTASSILSELINSAIKELPANAELIFPVEGNSSAPNRFLCKLKDFEENKIKELGEKLKYNVKAKFAEMALSALNAAGCKNKPSGFDAQIEDYLQISYAALPNDNSYEKDYIALESLLGAVKGSKTFNQLVEEGRKCSLCGQRNALFYANKKLNYQYSGEKVYSKGMDNTEGLCSVCITKRFYNKENVFPSTSKIALMGALNEAREARKDDKFNHDYEEFKHDYEEFNNIFGDDYDDQLMFEENLNEKYLEKQNIPIRGEKLNKAKELLKGINKFFKKYNIKTSKYYAMIMFDGDSMGKWLSGVYLKDKNKLEEFHKKLSKQLGVFADEVKKILVEPKGKVVYAGGEDFLGFVTLDYLFEIMGEMYIKFNQIVNNNLKEYTNNKKLTFSAGIIIVHYKMPFNAVLNKLRESEKAAKNIGSDKNGFALSVFKHSGEVNRTVYKWGNDENITHLFDSVKCLVNILVENKFTNTFLKNLQTEFEPLVNEDKVNSDFVFVEIERLIKKSYNQQKFGKEEKDKSVKELKAILIDLFYTTKNIENYFEMLNIAEFLSRYINEVKNDN